MKKGVVTHIDLEKYSQWIDEVSTCDKDSWGRYTSPFSSKITDYFEGKEFHDLKKLDEEWDNSTWSNTAVSARQHKLNALADLLDYSAKYDQVIEYSQETPEYLILEAHSLKNQYNNTYLYLVPKEFCQFEEYPDYSDCTVSQLGTNSVSDMFPAVPEKTSNEVKSDIANKQGEIENKKKEIEEKEAEVKAEIEAMKAQIEAKYKATFDLLEQKKAELDKQKEQLEAQLFILDAKIYGIRCANGEVIKFAQLTEGKRADKNTPLVLYQKIRFLDEELSKYVALYGFDGSDHNERLFEELIVNRKDLRDLFFAEDKSVSLVRISRDNKGYSSGQKLFAEGLDVGIQNVIDEYSVFHGDKIAILLRDGDNCYIGWTDDERVLIRDGNAFLKPGESVEEYNDFADRHESSYSREKRIKQERQDHLTEVSSRYYLFSAIQGAIDRNLINLPEGVSVVQNSPYIVFSMADGWLQDKGYGSLSDILDRYSGKLRQYDDILTTQSLRAERGQYVENNDRGIGYADRTHDVLCEDNTIYPINLLEKEDMFIARYTNNMGRTVHTTGTFKTVEEFMEDRDPEYYKDVTVEPYTQCTYYISLEKRWSYGNARANFRVYEDEFIPLVFLNSDLIKNVLVNRNLGSAFGRYNFSTSIKYLNNMLDYLKKREEVEEQLILEASELDTLPADWRIQLSDWKYEKDVHKITEFQAKRFAKVLK